MQLTLVLCLLISFSLPLTDGQGGPGAAFYPPIQNVPGDQLNSLPNLLGPKGPDAPSISYFPVLGEKPVGPKLVSIPKWLSFGEVKAAWVCSFLGCLAVILCGILPALFLPAQISSAFSQSDGPIQLNRLLSFAVGSLLGDVFLHILPETWHNPNNDVLTVGLWILAGLLLCFVVEKFTAQTADSQHTVTAVMNLVANMVDNFTHGLAVGGSFLVNIRFGMLTTFAILIHEIPHEISDFAILLRADFNRWAAIKAQLVTATGGIIGAIVALASASNSLSQSATGWILPFTAGGFLNIALVQVLPDLMSEKNWRESLRQILILLFGIFVMGFLNCLPA